MKKALWMWLILPLFFSASALGQQYASTGATVFVSPYTVGSYSGNDESQAILAAWSSCASGATTSCLVIDDLGGNQKFSVNPFPTGGRGGMLLFVAGNTHRIYTQVQLQVPSNTQMAGIGQANAISTGNFKNTAIIACNMAIFSSTNCPIQFHAISTGNGAYSSAITTTNGVTGCSGSGAGASCTVSLQTAMDTNVNDVNQMAVRRIGCLYNYNSNGATVCGPISVVGSSTSATFYPGSNIGNCTTGPCSGTFYIDIPMVVLGSGGGNNGFYGVEVSNLTLDCAYVPACGGWANGQAEELSYVQNVQVYNATVYFSRVETGSTIYGGAMGAPNSGPYGPNENNLVLEVCQIAGGCACVTGSYGCASNLVSQGASIACGAGTANGGIISPDPCQASFIGEMWTGTIQAGSYKTIRDNKSSISLNDPTNPGSTLAECVGQCVGSLYEGLTMSSVGSHAEYFNISRLIGSDTANTAWSQVLNDYTANVNILGGSDTNSSVYYVDIGKGLNGTNNIHVQLDVTTSSHALLDNVNGTDCTTNTATSLEYTMYQAGIYSAASPACGNLSPSQVVGFSTNAFSGGATSNTPSGTQYVNLSGRTAVCSSANACLTYLPRNINVLALYASLSTTTTNSLQFEAYTCSGAGCGTVTPLVTITCTITSQTCNSTGLNVSVAAGLWLGVEQIQTSTGTAATSTVTLLYQ